MNKDKLVELITRVGDDLGKGYSECIYQEGLCVLLRENNIIYSKEAILPKYYNNICIGNVRADIILEYEKTVIECKAIDGNLRDFHFPQIIVYMEILNYTKGYYVNFNQNPSMDFIEVYTVVRENNNYYFKNNNENICCLNNRGKKILIEETIEQKENEITWIQDNIIYTNNNDDILCKKKCKEIYPKFSKVFFETIETYCDKKFSSKQIAGIKYNQIILGYKLNNLM